MSENNGGSMMVGMLVGAVVGAGLALIFAPKSGSETRRDIGDAARKLRDSSRERVGGVLDAIHEGAGDIGAAINAGKDAYRLNSQKVPVGTEGA